MALTKAKLIADNAVKAVHIDETDTGITLAQLNVTGDITATNVAGTLSTAAQPNITSLGTLSSLNVSSTSVYQVTVQSTGAQYILIGSTDANSAGIILDGDSNGDGAGGDYSYIVHDTTGALKITQDSAAGTNEVWLGTSGTEGKVILDADGRLLVGSTSGRGGTTTGHIFKMPTGDSYFEIMANSTSGFSDILFSDGNTGAYGLFGYDHSTESIRLYTNSSEKLRVDSNGNVGIGTTNPESKLDVKSGALIVDTVANNYGGLKIDDDSTGDYNVNFRAGRGGSSSGFRWFLNARPLTSGAFSTGNERMALTNTGLGIGTSSPQEKLDVAGNIEFGARSGLFSQTWTWVGTPVNLCPYVAGTGGASILVMIHGHGNFTVSNYALYHISIHYDGSLNSSDKILGATYNFDVSGGYLRITNGNTNWAYTGTMLRNDR